MSCSVFDKDHFMQVNDLPINPSLIDKLRKAELHSLKKILHLCVVELQQAIKVTASEASTVLEAASRVVLESECSTAYSLLNNEKLQRQRLCLQFLQTDYVIYTGTITEICGESGSGKTQLCLHLSIYAQLPHHLGGLNSEVLYIHSEGDFPIKRFIQLAKAVQKQHASSKIKNVTDGLILKKVHNINEMMHVLQQSLPNLLQKGKRPKLIIIDSVAALLRSEYENSSVRTQLIQKFASEIWKLANYYRMAVVCINQVSGYKQNNLNVGSLTALDIPSLGLLWSNILTTRCILSRQTSSVEQVIRILELVYSSYHQNILVNFKITTNGIEII
ncbi:DNA repair protein XRCC3-like [Stegodyphus dumicola]|uniref:DNA repair protein XRCC3-like n=1 Tax=Stegodyphus dumicola TaxID=202533 RepID=UPI0015B083E1|nr:DNA repair protein XRCC3-like [Stegodyphus dumicola]